MKKLIIRRIIEVIGVELLISVLAMSLYFFNLLKNYLVIFSVSAIILVFYIGWTVWCLYKFRLVFDGKKRFFLINAPVYSVLFGSAIIAGYIADCLSKDFVYSFLFMPFKLFHYAAFIWSFPGAGRMTRPVSAMLVSFIIAIPVIVIPFFLSTNRKLYIKRVEKK